MKNILSYDKFSVNEGIINTIRRAISKKQDLDDIVEGIFKNIKSNFYMSNLITNKNKDYSVTIAYKFNDTDLIKINTETKARVDRDYANTVFILFINDDNITDLVNKYLIEEIHDFLIEKLQKKDVNAREIEKYDLKKKITKRYGENGGSAANPMGYGYQPIDNLDTTKPPMGDDSKPEINPAPR